MTAADMLTAYHYQPNLERRNHLLKRAQEVAPVYLEPAHRIKALLLCHFLAMLTEALIERGIRTAMSSEGLDGIPLYPKLRNCPTLNAPRILEIFTDLQRHQLIKPRRSDRAEPFNLTSATYNGRCWTSSTPQPASTTRPRSREMGGRIDHEKCGTSVIKGHSNEHPYQTRLAHQHARPGYVTAIRPRGRRSSPTPSGCRFRRDR